MARQPVKVSDLRRFLDASGAQWTCPSCNSRAHGTIVDEVAENGRLSLSVMTFPDHDPLSAAWCDVIGLVCDNCAHIRLYHHTTVASWAAQNPPN